MSDEREKGEAKPGHRPPPQITLPTLTWPYRNQHLHYFDGRLYVNGYPVTERRPAL